MPHKFGHKTLIPQKMRASQQVGIQSLQWQVFEFRPRGA